MDSTSTANMRRTGTDNTRRMSNTGGPTSLTIVTSALTTTTRVTIIIRVTTTIATTNRPAKNKFCGVFTSGRPWRPNFFVTA